MEQAQNQLASHKKSIESECEAVLQRERDAERRVIEIKHKITELSVALEQEIASKQKLNIELAVLNERLIKQDETFTTQKKQYEDRLNRAYEEKDIHIAQHVQLQNEMKIWQEKLALQTEQQQKALAQQNILHEQSETRWLNLVDQAKQEVKETHKKMENQREKHDAQIKNLKNTLSDLQQNWHEKNTQLNVTLEQVNHLNKDIKLLESELIKERSTIIGLEENIKLKNMATSIENKSKKIRAVITK